MNITIIVDQYGAANNGTTMTSRRFAQGFKKLGHNVNIICAVDSVEEGINIVPLGGKKYPFVQGILESQGMVFSKINKEKLYEVIKKSDICHFILPFKMERAAKKICDELNVPSTAAFHCQPENITSTIYMNKFAPLNNYIYRRFRKFYNKFDHVHCPSTMIANQLTKHKYKSTLHVISNGVSSNFKKIDVLKPEELKDKFIILMVGRYSREKRQDLIIKAVKESKYEKNIQIIFAGKGPWKKHLSKLGKKLTNKIIFGFYNQEELLNVINYSDLYIHASDAEIEAISCMEAFTCGLVPIISDNPLVATSQFALDKDINLFKTGNYKDLKNKIEFLYENPDIKERLSNEYIEYAKQYQLDNCVKRMLDVFNEVIENSKKNK